MTEKPLYIRILNGFFDYLVWSKPHPLTWRRLDLWPVLQRATRGWSTTLWLHFFGEVMSFTFIYSLVYKCSVRCSAEREVITRPLWLGGEICNTFGIRSYPVGHKCGLEHSKHLKLNMRAIGSVFVKSDKLMSSFVNNSSFNTTTPTWPHVTRPSPTDGVFLFQSSWRQIHLLKLNSGYDLFHRIWIELFWLMS